MQADIAVELFQCENKRIIPQKKTETALQKLLNKENLEKLGLST